MSDRLAEIKARTNPNPNVDADRHWLIAEVERLEADQEHWRKGVALIASVFGMKYLACVAIYERVLEQTTKFERLKAHISRLEKMLEDHAVDGKGLAVLAHLEVAAAEEDVALKGDSDD